MYAPHNTRVVGQIALGAVVHHDDLRAGWRPEKDGKVGVLKAETRWD
jgi:hypothetical protein